MNGSRKERNTNKKSHGRQNFIPAILKSVKTEPVKLALLILLVFQFGLMAHSNLTLIWKSIDCDLAKLFVHIAEVCKQKTLLLEGWDYLTTLEWDCSSLLAIPFYGVTHSITLSFGLANIIQMGCFLWLIFFLHRGEDSICPLLCINLLMIPYRTGMLDYYNMLFFGGGQYIIKVFLPLLLIGIILYMEAKSNDKQQRRSDIVIWILMAVFLGLLFLSAMSSGVYVTVCGIFPVFMVYIGYKFFKWEKISNSAVLLMICSGILALAGWRINVKLMGGALGNSMKLCSVHQLLDSISSCFFGIFELFGGATESFEIPVLSIAGIQIVAKSCLVLTILISGIISIARQIRKKGNLRSLLLLAVFLWNYFVLNTSFPRAGSMTYEYRYHLIGIVPLICAACSLWIEGIRKLHRRQQNCLYAAGLMAILFLCVTSYKNLYSQGELNPDLKELCAYVKEFDVDYIYMYNDIGSSEICRLILEEPYFMKDGVSTEGNDMECLCLLEEGVTYAYDYYNKYNDVPMQTENALVAVNEAQYLFGDSMEIAGYKLKKIHTVANWDIYCFE